MKILHNFLKAILTLIIATPVLGLTGQFPPKPEYYNSSEAYNFINILMSSASFIQIGIVLACVSSIYCLWTRREFLAGLILLPITYNVMAFHAFLDGGLLTGGAVMGNIMSAINFYLLWKNKKHLLNLIKKQF